MPEFRDIEFGLNILLQFLFVLHDMNIARFLKILFKESESN